MDEWMRSAEEREGNGQLASSSLCVCVRAIKPAPIQKCTADEWMMMMMVVQNEQTKRASKINKKQATALLYLCPWHVWVLLRGRNTNRGVQSVQRTEEKELRNLFVREWKPHPVCFFPIRAHLAQYLSSASGPLYFCFFGAHFLHSPISCSRIYISFVLPALHSLYLRDWDTHKSDHQYLPSQSLYRSITPWLHRVYFHICNAWRWAFAQPPPDPPVVFCVSLRSNKHFFLSFVSIDRLGKAAFRFNKKRGGET